MSISTRNLKALPDPRSLKALLQSLATLDAIISPEWGMRYFSFDARWSNTEQVGSMRNGSGDGFFAVFNPAGSLIKGFDHESPMSPYRVDPPKLWADLLDNVPEVFSSVLSEPAFSMSDITFCIWRKHADSAWSCGPVSLPDGNDPDGSGMLLNLLDGEPANYCTFAAEYYEVELSVDAVRGVYNHVPLDSETVTAINPDVSIDQLAGDLDQIGFPTN